MSDGEPNGQERALAQCAVLAEYQLGLMLNSPAGTPQYWPVVWDAVEALTRLARFCEQPGFDPLVELRPEMVELARQQAKALL